MYIRTEPRADDSCASRGTLDYTFRQEDWTLPSRKTDRLRALTGRGRSRADLRREIDELRAQLAEVAADAARAGDEARDALATATNATGWVGDAEQLAARGLAQAEDATAAAANAAVAAQSADAAAAQARRESEDAAAGAAVAGDTAREALLSANVAAFAEWLRLMPPGEAVEVSVILPTRDRPALLPHAIASVVAQTYPRWELLVVDDGDGGRVDEAVRAVDDARVVAIPGPRRGLSAARNAGLDQASGDVVCYLDDDNAMHPLWLSAVARVFGEREDVDVAYGVSVAEHRVPGTLDPGGWWPFLWQLPWSRERLLQENVTDAGALAHRRELPEARFDDVGSGEDWDLLIRLTYDRPALAVPAISHAYAMSGDDRMSNADAHRQTLEEIRRAHGGP